MLASLCGVRLAACAGATLATLACIRKCALAWACSRPLVACECERAFANILAAVWASGCVCVMCFGVAFGYIAPRKAGIGLAVRFQPVHPCVWRRQGPLGALAVVYQASRGAPSAAVNKWVSNLCLL
eukprot:Opistho-2@8742